MNKKPKELDKQSPVFIDEWLDIDSNKCKMLDDDRAFTKKCILIGMESGFMSTDSDGRYWGFDAKKNTYYPLHFNVGNKLYGYKQSKKASN